MSLAHIPGNICNSAIWRRIKSNGVRTERERQTCNAGRLVKPSLIRVYLKGNFVHISDGLAGPVQNPVHTLINELHMIGKNLDLTGRGLLQGTSRLPE
jgi:hypothetical protein